MILDEVLRLDAVVLYALMGQRVQSNCFLAQGITAVFFILQDASTAPELHIVRPLTVGMPLLVSNSAIATDE